MEDSSGIPEELENLRYTDNPEDQWIILRTAQEKLGMSVSELARFLFQDCLTERDFSEKTQKWIDAFNRLTRENWTSEELKEWVMRQRGLQD